MAVLEVRKATQEDAEQLYELMTKSKGAKLALSKNALRRDLSSLHRLNFDLEARENHDVTFEFDVALMTPNCPACQAFLATIDGSLVGYLIFHYFYTPWRGRMVFIDDMFAEEAYGRIGIARGLLDNLSTLCSSEQLGAILFNSSDLDSELIELSASINCRVVRDDSSDWSVYRVDF